jgi:hypothetical protein
MFFERFTRDERLGVDKNLGVGGIGERILGH